MKYYYILAIILIIGVGAVTFGNFYNQPVEQTPKPIVIPDPEPEPIFVPEPDPIFAPEPPDNLKQGIQGILSIITGNCMPMIIVPGVDDSSSCDDSTVSRNIFIRIPATMDDMNEHIRVYLSNKSKLVKQIKSNNQGEYSVELEPGDYSVFVELVSGDYRLAGYDEGEEYCNSFGLYGESCLVTVEPGKFIKYDINIDNAVW